MSETKLDYKKEYKDLYAPGNKPMLIDVPSINFIMIDGKGDPGRQEYQDAVTILYSLSYTIKMSKMNKVHPEGYFEYVVPPLEGLWWIKDGTFDFDQRDNWLWTSMIRQPEFVTKEIFEWACNEIKRKKPEINVSIARLVTFTEGLCVQIMHKGPYEREPESVEKIRNFIEGNNLFDEVGSERKHHEIYLSDPRKTDAESLKTVLRHPVRRK